MRALNELDSLEFSTIELYFEWLRQLELRTILIGIRYLMNLLQKLQHLDKIIYFIWAVYLI
jgi:hypothetical protein